MRLRKLEVKDAALMLEWMHDEDIIHYMCTDFASKTVNDCIDFILESRKKLAENIHLAVVDDIDQYMGTVSLKHMNNKQGTAEFAITVRKCAMGKGISKYGMEQILKIGFEQYGLRRIFWCVSSKNKRAVRFYDKNGYIRVCQVPKHISEKYSSEQLKEYIWYEINAKAGKGVRTISWTA